jgi:hypothetical protein
MRYKRIVDRRRAADRLKSTLVDARTLGESRRGR